MINSCMIFLSPSTSSIIINTSLKYTPHWVPVSSLGKYGGFGSRQKDGYKLDVHSRQYIGL